MTTSLLTAARHGNHSGATRSLHKMLRLAAALAALVAMSACTGNKQSAAGPGAAAQERPLTEDQVAETVHFCSVCHGPGDNDLFPAFPLLAGQQKDYLSAQIKAFRDKTRADPRARNYMWGVAASLDDAMIERVAAYYSAQKPPSGSAQEFNRCDSGKDDLRAGHS